MIRWNVDASAAVESFAAFRASKLRDLMTRVRVLVEGQTKARFVRQEDPTGKSWAPLAPSTIAGRRKGSRGILKDTGRLMGSISGTSDTDEAVVGTNVFYGRYHQYGVEGDPGEGTSVDIPARPFLGMGKRDLRDLRKVVNRWVEDHF